VFNYPASLYTPPGGGRFGSECLADLLRNRWPISNGISGRFGAELVAGLVRNLHTQNQSMIKTVTRKKMYQHLPYLLTTGFRLGEATKNLFDNL